MTKKLTYVPSLALLLAVPLLAFAQQTVTGLIVIFQDIINALVPFLIAVAVLVFIFGVVTYITAAGDETKVAAGRKYVLYGILGLVVIVAVWGFVNLILNTLDLDTDVPTVPTLPSIP